MIDLKIYHLNTKSVVNRIMLKIVELGVCNNTQEVGAFIDSVQGQLALTTAHYHLSQCSHGKCFAADAVFREINRIVYMEMTKVSNYLLMNQLEQIKGVIFRVIMESASGLYDINTVWDECRLVQSSPHDFAINASRTSAAAAASAQGRDYRTHGGLKGSRAA